jgi:hypothetical protein
MGTFLKLVRAVERMSDQHDGPRTDRGYTPTIAINLD